MLATYIYISYNISSMQDQWLMGLRPSAREKRKPRGRYVSINRRGEIVMNAAAWRVLKGTYNVTLVWNPKWRCIGVKYPSLGEHQAVYPMRMYGRGRKLRIVRARAALKCWGVEVERTMVFKDVFVEEFDGVPMLALYFGHAEELSVVGCRLSDRQGEEVDDGDC
jgi:hypothetical protein